MAIKHVKVVSTVTYPDDGTSPVGTNEWNDDHTIDDNTITDAMVNSHTTTKITVPTTQLSGTVTNAQLAGSIANTKLATDPLARANHTGTQAASTVSDFDTEVANNSAVTANTAKTGITSGQASAITANTAKISYSTAASNAVAANTTLLGATAGTVTASKALIVDASKDLTGINDLTVAGDLTVNGTTTTINSTTLTVDDKNIEMGSVASPTDITADGGGITLKGSTDKTINWVNSTDSWTFNQAVDISGNNVDNIQNLIHDFSTATTTLDFAGDELQEITISADTTFAASSNIAIGKSKTVIITTDATIRTLAFPAGWKFIGATPVNQAASKVGVLTLTCRTGIESGIIASYGVEE
mgnify:CR=1 FL=1|tara:strand:- start:613 stop:1686 length:1074 start_codon:yes stop_codon:yes gene_type:complete